MISKLDIRLFGGFQISYEGKPLPGLESMRLQTLLSYLVLHQKVQHSRQYLSFFFWPDSNESQARTNLRQVLHHLRRAIPDIDSFLQIESQTIRWNPKAPFTLDVADFERNIERSKKLAEKREVKLMAEVLEIAVELYHGDLFPECYSEWIEPVRERLKDEYLTALHLLMEHFENQRVYQKAIHYAERLLFCDKLRENTYLDLMRLHALNKDRASSIRIYNECEKILKKELGIKPGSSVQTLYKQLLNDDQVENSVSVEKKEEQENVMPMVGRQKEWVRLKELWDHIKSGNSYLVIISGEAGIGKTRLAQEMVQWTSRQGYTTASTRCYAAENSLSYTPLNEWLRSEKIRPFLNRLDSVYLAEVARLLPELLIENHELSAPNAITDRWQRRNFFEALARVILSVGKPILLFIDDLQWCDLETLEWIHFLLRFEPRIPLVVLGTVRIEEMETDHPLRMVVSSLHRSGQVSEIELQPLSAYETGLLAEQVYGNDLDDELRAYLYKETEGNPLFLVESIHTLLAGSENDFSEEPDLCTLKKEKNTAIMPDKVKNVILSRLGMVSPKARKAASYASAIGRNFNIELLVPITGFSKEKLIEVLDELLQRRIFREQSEGNFDFSHDKLREVSYASMYQAERAIIHGKIADAMVQQYRANPGSVSSQIASHYEQAGEVKKAIQYFEKAAKVVLEVYALEEATRLLGRALDLLQTLPDNMDRDRRELSLRLVLGPLLTAIKGYHAPEVREDYHRIHTLSSRLGQDVNPPVLRSMAISCVVQGDLKESLRLGQQLLQIAEQEKHSVLEVEGHYVTGVSSFWLGNLHQSRVHLEKAINCFDPRHEHVHIEYYAQQPKIICQIRLAWTYLYLGYPEKAEHCYELAIAEARKCGHPFSLAYVLMYGAFIKTEFRDIDAAQKLTDECVTLTEERTYKLWYTIATVFQSWIHFQVENDIHKVEELQDRLVRQHEAGIRLKSPFYTCLLARAWYELDRKEEALKAVDNALELVKIRGESWFLAEILREKGKILSDTRGRHSEAENWFWKAREVAREQGSRMLELRAICDLVKLFRNQDKIGETVEMLREVYDQFTEGGNTPDLLEAAELIEELRVET